ncbi:uncharacterized protein ATC70_009354 [Mucor velutinosus]|uniref:Magnesium transporter n=1 Tax=Mucor velutinosus TaxID=708070 RepID=A0AAN7DL51_9FUNG|nr:hypothetical protein ATC70_009354 [Mucor velutinosus]
MTLEGRYIGLILAICSSLLIGISFVVTKKGLQNSSTAEHGRASDSHRYLKNPVWWIGLIVMVMGEILNFIGYTFAPAILITPLGALSVIVGAILGSIFLKEKMGPIGIIGCLLSVIGAVIIIFHAPEDPDVQSVQELVAYMLKPGLYSVFSGEHRIDFLDTGFLVYGILVILIVVGMIWKCKMRLKWKKKRQRRLKKKRRQQKKRYH